MRIQNKPKVSVITPAYNVENFIANTVSSVLNQTYKNIELIIIDDCSSDRTIEIVKSFKDSRIIILENHKNYGAAYCRNKAIKIATGVYIAFLDGDDLWLPNKLEKQLKFMIANNYYFTYTKYGVLKDYKEIYEVSGPLIISHRLFLRYDFVGCLTVMYKKSICPDLCIPNDLLKNNDYALWLKLSEHNKCYLLDEKLSLYNKREGSISSSKKIYLFKYHFILFKNLYGYNSIRCFFYSLRNVFYYFAKNFLYVRKVNN